jgi:mannose-6-phosphate isomerase-like protein (cupin superfamily)
VAHGRISSTHRKEAVVSASYAVGQRDDRPWGHWEILGVGPSYAVKRILVHPGARLSLQRHAHRAEHWVIVAGCGNVTRGDEVIPVTAGQHVVIGLGDAHRIENSGTEDLLFIEVQHGPHIDESDIERLQDDYGRS